MSLLKVNYTMKNRLALFCGSILAFTLMSACATAPQPGTPVTHATACTEENNDQRIAIEGYPRLTGMFTMVSDDLSFQLFEQAQGQGESISVRLIVGTGANQVEDLPDDYTDADLKIHTHDNQVVSTDDPIRVHGTLRRYEDGSGGFDCYVGSVDLVEAAASEK